MSARDFDLIADLATAWPLVLKSSEARTYWKPEVEQANNDARAVTGEALARYEALVMGLMPATLEYRQDMSEAELRAFTASLMEALR